MTELSKVSYMNGSQGTENKKKKKLKKKKLSIHLKLEN